MKIRSVAPEDADELARLMNNIEESGFMKYNPGERIFNKDKVKSLISKIHKDKNSQIFVRAILLV